MGMQEVSHNFGSGLLPTSVSFSLSLKVKPLCLKGSSSRSESGGPLGFGETGRERMKSTAQGHPGAPKESCLYWRSPLPCIPLPRARASLEKARMRGWLTFRGVSWAGAATNTQKSHLHRSTHSHMHLVPPAPVSLIVLSVTMHSRVSSLPEWITHGGL